MQKQNKYNEKNKSLNQIKSILIIFIVLGFFIVFLFSLSISPSLPSQPILSSSFKESGYSKKLQELSINTLDITCENHLVTINIEFNHLEGRSPLNVATSTKCTKDGDMFHWGAMFNSNDGYIAARENYNVNLIINLIKDTIEKNHLSINIYNQDIPELSDILKKKFDSATQEKRLKAVLFTCNKNGDFYSYKSELTYSRELKTGTLTAVCNNAHQNFSINVNDSNFRVHTYNQVSSETILNVYKEFLGGTPELLSF